MPERVNNNDNYVQPQCSFAQPAVWRPGTALDIASQWPGTRDEPLSMRGDCAICGTGAEFPRASARRLPDVSSSVFIALAGFYLTEFSSLRPNVRDFPAGWVAPLFAFTEPARPPLQHRFMVSLPHLPHCTGTNSRFRWTLQYFCILQGQVLSSSPSDKLSSVSSYIRFASWQLRAGKQLSSVSSYIGFASWQLLASPHSRKVARKIFLAFHWTLKWNNSITEPTTSTQSRTWRAHMGVGTLNQSTSQGWLCLRGLFIVISGNLRTLRNSQYSCCMLFKACSLFTAWNHLNFSANIFVELEA